MTETANFTSKRRRPKPALVVLIVLLHALVLYGLMKALAPGFTGSLEDEVTSVFSVTITTPDEVEEPVEPEPEGAAGNPGKEAVPQPQTAPETIIKRDRPMPKASSTGAAVTSGARDEGEGTGASGNGEGTGSGRGGGGQGGGAVTKPSVRSGELNQARDFPVPEGGRQTRFGKKVVVVLTVGTDGVAKNCSILRNGVDAQTAALVCPLVIQKIRFNPATRRDGSPVEARYGYQVEFSGS